MTDDLRTRVDAALAAAESDPEHHKALAALHREKGDMPACHAALRRARELERETWLADRLRGVGAGVPCASRRLRRRGHECAAMRPVVGDDVNE